MYWHIIRKDTTVANGNVPSSAINAQISELNTRYGPSVSRYSGHLILTVNNVLIHESGTFMALQGFSFYLAGTDTTTSANWFDYAGPGT